MGLSGRNNGSQVFDLESLQQTLDTLTPLRSSVEFQEIVRMRKEEVKANTELKRKHAETIMLRNEKESKLKLFGLPDEMWEIILSHVKNPIDLGNMWEVHPKFRDLSALSQIDQCLWYKVLSIDKLPYLWEDEETRWATYKMFRTLSSGIRTAVDLCIENYFMKALESGDNLLDRYYLNMRIESIVCLDNIFRNFAEEPIETRAKRAFGRSLRLVYRRDTHCARLYPEDNASFIHKMTLLLEIIGNQLWHFSFALFANNSGTLLNETASFCENYFQFQHWLTLMPNLKWLEFDFAGSSLTLCPTIPQATYQEFPFPILSDLERVTSGFFMFCSNNPGILTSVLRSNSHIKTLEFKGYRSPNTPEIALFWSDELRNVVSSLNLDNFQIHPNVFPALVLEIMQPIISRNWMLKCLALNLDEKSLVPVFNYLNSISTLEQLFLHMGNIIIGEELPFLKLPNLVHFGIEFNVYSINYLDIENVISFTSLRFLVLARKLKTLSWAFGKYKFDSFKTFRDYLVTCRQFEMIRFQCGLQKLAQSNIWQVFPELECVKTSVPFNDENNCNRETCEIRRFKLL